MLRSGRKSFDAAKAADLMPEVMDLTEILVALDRSGLLTKQGEEYFFSHDSFQSFLAAGAIAPHSWPPQTADLEALHAALVGKWQLSAVKLMLAFMSGVAARQTYGNRQLQVLGVMMKLLTS